MTKQSTTNSRGQSPGDRTRPEQHLIAYRRRNPEVFKLVDPMRALREEGDPSWPAWCFLPLEDSYCLLYGNQPPEEPNQLHEAIEMAALAAWRVSQGIYRLSSECLESVEELDIDEKIPTEALMDLPQWCLYVETPDDHLFGMPAAGFFAHLLPAGDRPQLRLLLDVDDSPQSRILGKAGSRGYLGSRPWDRGGQHRPPSRRAGLYTTLSVLRRS